MNQSVKTLDSEAMSERSQKISRILTFHLGTFKSGKVHSRDLDSRETVPACFVGKSYAEASFALVFRHL